MGRWRDLRMTGVLAIAGSVIFGMSSVAQADSPISATHPLKRSNTSFLSIKYHNSWLFKSRPLNRCIRFRTHGTIKYTVIAHPNPRNPPPTFEFKDIKLTNPVVTAAITHLRSDGSCGLRQPTSKFLLGQHWAGFACNFNPSLSVSVPWGVSIGAWPSCGQREQATYTGPPFGRGSFYKQSNSGSPTQFGNTTIDQVDLAPCYGIFPSAVAFVRNNSDSFGAGNLNRSKKACLKKP